MWLVTTYQHTSLFSLRNSSATSSGGKTNLIPTMYSVKMALLDAAFRMGLDVSLEFPWIRDLEIRFEPPEQAVVNNSFIKILTEPKDKKAGPAFITSVGFREFVFYDGTLKIAVKIENLTQNHIDKLKLLFFHVNYFGKRGGFLQPICQGIQEYLGSTFSYFLGENGKFSSDVIMQYLDDMGPKATFPSINTFDDTAARIGRDRIMKSVFVPYHQVASSRGYTWFKRESSGSS
ncbi:type I-A CRISPR-associated protein Cas5 [Fodinisporobacter ferrooxydans]|uniref:Type I-A CRISPR-associated protein Cas5 n=1 Tax=Fodinisporobacter ferrooxydans TaxID=2901836 RepID=A0ABY4CM87_9BACL|nr:type I-A CRISPR-associated protein Cas5 [Alicyclobacillaceae bacterium MYW30-H2]